MLPLNMCPRWLNMIQLRSEILFNHNWTALPEAIRTLMLVKQWLGLARTAVHDILGD
jgi:hypothetical protein